MIYVDDLNTHDIRYQVSPVALLVLYLVYAYSFCHYFRDIILPFA